MKTSFPIIGMHCASCARLIEKKLKNTPGVSDAAVNYGSEQATVDFDPKIRTLRDLGNLVTEMGYRAIITEGKGETPEDLKEEAKKKELAQLSRKVIVSAVLSVFIVLGSFPEWFGGALSAISSQLSAILSNPLTLLLLAT